MKANITDIKRFAVHDGDGIRTTVFFKGCPLRCLWCHNPETLSGEKQLLFYAHKCVACGRCAAVCKYHQITGNAHSIDRERCTLCGACVSVCPQNALAISGKWIDTEEIINTLLEDRLFYEESGGGITLSGGECLLQSAACREILMRMKSEGIHTAVDTCGAAPRKCLEEVLAYTDLFLYDIKAYKEPVHIQCTGHSNKLILENLLYLDQTGKEIEIRIPYVPGYNGGEMEEIAEFLSTLSHIRSVRILPYHNYAASKYAALGMKNTLPPTLPSDSQMQQVQNLFQKHGLFVRD